MTMKVVSTCKGTATGTAELSQKSSNESIWPNKQKDFGFRTCPGLCFVCNSISQGDLAILGYASAFSMKQSFLAQNTRASDFEFGSNVHDMFPQYTCIKNFCTPKNTVQVNNVLLQVYQAYYSDNMNNIQKTCCRMLLTPLNTISKG